MNRYVETLSDLIGSSPLKDSRSLKIVDMGSGKGYLTFAAYDYFSNTRGLAVEMTGVESRGDLVGLCNEIAAACGFDGLKFVEGDIAGTEVGDIDVLIALHACDTATDDAIYKGITGRAKLIVTAPCCHKELRPQITAPDQLAGIMKHGIISERLAETVTDGLRALLMEECGYATRIFEFISTEHTPKNNMLVGIRHTHSVDNRGGDEYSSLRDMFGVDRQRLGDLLGRG